MHGRPGPRLGPRARPARSTAWARMGLGHGPCRADPQNFHRRGTLYTTGRNVKRESRAFLVLTPERRVFFKRCCQIREEQAKGEEDRLSAEHYAFCSPLRLRATEKQKERMAQSLPGINPPKTFNCGKTPLFPSIRSLRPHQYKIFTTPRTKELPIVSLSVMSNQPQPSLDVLTRSHRRDDVLGSIRSSLSNCLTETNLLQTVPGLKSKTIGKVRDIYDGGDYLVLVTTDRQSAFDRILASIPFKGQVLNETSLWWFEKTRHITPNAVVSAPDKNVTIAKKCSVFPVEFVVRGFVTGSTDTSLWTVYKKGVRNYCGNILPDGLVKNQKLLANILTPTTKAEDHDVPVTPTEIIERGLMTQAEYDEASRKALSLFEYGQHVALEHGLILVDTKYEFGKGSDGTILLIDEVHTPDSSRYWISHSYEERFQNGLEPENVDKEFLRLWFKDHCNPYEDEVLPDAPEDLVCELAWRYIFLYETITVSKFEMPGTKEPIHDRISRNVSKALASL